MYDVSCVLKYVCFTWINDLDTVYKFKILQLLA